MPPDNNIRDRPAFPGAVTPHGFTWGPLEVVRITSEPAIGVILGLETEKEHLEIRVTPKGLIRVGTVSKPEKRHARRPNL